MASSRKTAVNTRREMSRQRRREQLIRATIQCISKSGLSGVTMAGVTETAGLSLGIVNLHFESKEKLLVETLRYVAEEYRKAWKSILENTQLTAAEKLRRLVDMDFSTRVASRSKISVWFAFWSETKSRPLYRQICAEADLQYDQALLDTCIELANEANLSADSARGIAATYSALSNGLWLDLLICHDQMKLKDAKEICLQYLANAFGSAFAESTK